MNGPDPGARSPERPPRSDASWGPVGEGFLCLDPRGRCTFANGAANRMLGYETGELLGVDLHRLVHRARMDGSPYPEDVCPIRRALEKGEECRSVEGVFRRKDGGPLPVEYSAHPLVQEGEVRGAAVTFVDAGGRGRFEEALRESEERYRALVEATADAVIVVEEDRTISSVNGAAERLFGYAGPEMVGEKLAMLMPERLGAGNGAAFARYLDGGEGSARRRPVVLPGLRKDGEEVPLEVSYSGFSVGGKRCFVVLCRDVTERAWAREAGSRYAAILEATTDFVGMADVGGRVLSLNRAGREMVGVGQDEDVSGTTIADYHPAWAREVVLGEGVPTAVREGAWSGETALHAPDGGEIPVSQVILAHGGPDGEVRFLSTIARDITDRKRAEEDLAESRQMFEGIAEVTLDLLYVSEMAGGRNVYANRRAEKILGYTREQLAAFEGAINEKLVHPEDRAHALADWARLAYLEDGEVQEHEFRARHADGSYRWLRARNVVLSRTEDGRASRVLGLAQDVTGRKRAEEALRESNGRIEHILESITDAFVAVDREWRYTYVNERALRHIQKARGEKLTREWLLGKSMWEVFPEATGSVFYRRYHEALRERKTVEFEAYSPPRDSWVEQYAYPSEEGLSIYYRDITERKKAEEALRDSEERFRALAAATFEGIAVHDKGVMIEANEALARMFGYEPAEVVGKSALELAAPESRELIRENIASGSEEPYEAVGLRKDGTRFQVELRGRPFEYRGRTVRATAIRDVTERKRAEEGLREALGEARRYASQLRGLARAALAVNSAPSVDGMLRTITERAREIVGVHLAVTSLAADENRERSIDSVSLSDKYAGAGGFSVEAGGSGVYSLVRRTAAPTRMTQEELEAHPDFRRSGWAVGEHQPLRGWLAAPLVGRGGENIGVVGLSDKYEGDFDANDEAVLVHLAQMASVALENARLYRQATSAIDSLSAQIAILDESGKIVATNRTWRRFAEANGATQGSVGEGVNYLEVCDAVEGPGVENAAAFAEGIRAVLSGSVQSFEMEYPCPTPAERRWFVGRVTRFPDLEPPRAVVAHEDVTERKRVAESMLEAREAERRRIARDLHDVVLQNLTGALQSLQAIQVERAGDDDDPGFDLGRETEALRRSVDGLRAAIYGLRSEKERRFVYAVESLVDLNRQMASGHGLRMVVEDGFPEDLPSAIAGELLLIVQEALINARRHSGARHVLVILRSDPEGVGVEVADDGRGFLQETTGGAGFGLRGMRERALRLGGELRVRSRPGEGTRVEVRVPARAFWGFQG